MTQSQCLPLLPLTFACHDQVPLPPEEGKAGAQEAQCTGRRMFNAIEQAASGLVIPDQLGADINTCTTILTPNRAADVVLVLYRHHPHNVFQL